MTRPILGSIAAIATTTVLDASGLTAFSALPLCPLLILFAYLERLSPSRLGFVRGRAVHYGLAALHPLAVLGAAALIATAAGATDLSEADWAKTSRNVALVAVSTFLVAILTEEGFFRGWLWASLERAGEAPGRVLAFSGIVFSLWHLSWITLTEDRLPVLQIPVFLLNAALLGVIWGLLRWISGSVIVASLSHGVWNGLDYVLFGAGAHVGALGITSSATYGPEVGVLGLVLNGAFAVALWLWKRSRS